MQDNPEKDKKDTVLTDNRKDKELEILLKEYEMLRAEVVTHLEAQSQLTILPTFFADYRNGWVIRKRSTFKLGGWTNRESTSNISDGPLYLPWKHIGIHIQGRHRAQCMNLLNSYFVKRLMVSIRHLVSSCVVFLAHMCYLCETL